MRYGSGPFGPFGTTAIIIYISVDAAQTTTGPIGLGYTRVLGHQYLYIRVFIRIRVYMD